MAQVKEEEITNEEIRRRFGNVPKAEGTWRNMKLLLVGKITRARPSKCPKWLLTATCEGKRVRGRPLRTNRDSFVDGLKLLINDIDETCCLKD